MKQFLRKINLVLFATYIVAFGTDSFSKEQQIQYSQDNVSNYFSGIVSARKDDTKEAFAYLNKVQFLKNKHNNFNIEFLKTLVLLEKFDEAFLFSKSIWNENEVFFETDFLLGLNSFINKDFKSAEKST